MWFPDLPQPVIEGLESPGFLVALGVVAPYSLGKDRRRWEKNQSCGAGHFLLERWDDRLEEGLLKY